MKIAGISVLTVLAFQICVCLSERAFADPQIADIRDTLDTAVRGPVLLNGVDDPALDFYVADHQSFDNNVFRLANGVDVQDTVGAGASRADHVNSPAAGLDGQWVLGRQIVNVQLQAADNRYADNTSLNNVSTNDRVAWNWGLGRALSGQLGADYTRALLSFANALVYSRNTYQQSEYFASGRYQVGPRWALYGGFLQNIFNVEDAVTNYNDFRRKAVDMGAELATGSQDTLGLDYRYTDARYPNSIVLENSSFNPDYREDRVRLMVKRALTEKTSIDVSAGYLRRNYGDSIIGSFSGPVWRAALGWQPTEKTQLVFATWRELQAYLTDATNYYRTTGASIAPTWVPSEKISVSLTVSRESLTFIGSSGDVQNQLARRDTINSQAISLFYTPIRALTFDVSYRHEQRGSNQALRAYNDDLAVAGVKFVFL